MLEHVERPGFRKRPVGKRQTPQVAEKQRHALARVLGEKRADVDADRLGAEVAVPDERAPAAAAEVDDQVAGPGPQKLPQHVVADLRSEKRRRNALVARVGVQGFVEVFRLLREGVSRAQVQILIARGLVEAAAALARQLTLSAGAAGQGAAALGAADERNQSIGNHRVGASTSLKRISSRSARRSQLYSATASRAALPSRGAKRRVVDQPSDAARKRIRVARRDEQGVDLVGQNFAERRQPRRHDGLAGGHVFEQLERRRRVRRDRRRGIGQRHDVCARELAGDGRGRQMSGERHPVLDAQSFGERPQPREIRFLLVAAHDEAAHLGHLRDRLEQHVDALPGVEMTRIGDRAGCQGARGQVPSATVAG